MLNGPRRFSHSQLMMYLKCGYQYYRAYILKQKIPPGIRMVRGGAQSTAQERDLSFKIETGCLLPTDAVTQAAVDDVSRRMESRDDVTIDDEDRGKPFSELRDRARDLARITAEHHHDNLAPKLEPAAVEQRLEFRLPGVPRVIVGYADVIETNDVIRDTKTTDKTPAKDAAEKTDQLAIYREGWRQKTGRESPQQTLDYMVVSTAAKPRTPVKIETRVTENGPNDVARVAARMRAAIGAIEAGHFPPAPEGAWWCSPRWCGYHATCPYVKGGAVVSVPGIND